MEHTWEPGHLPRLEALNLEQGDVALCGSLAGQAATPPGLDRERIALLASLRTRADLEWLLRGLLLYPGIRHLVLWGDDEYATGEALRVLWQQGLGESGQLPDSRGRLGDELDAATLDALRADVQLIDLRGRLPNEVAAAVEELPLLGAQREPRPLPNPQIPLRKVFHSRQTTFPIFSGDVGDSWLQLLNLALKIGIEKGATDGQRVAETLNAVVTIETPQLEDGKPEEKGEVFPGFFDFNHEDFECRYPLICEKRLLAGAGVERLEAVIDRLRVSPDTRAGSVIFNDTGESSALVSATFNVVESKLFASFVLGSCDLYSDWPLESTALVRLQFEVARRLGIDVGSAIFVIHSAYLDADDWARSQRVLDEHFRRPLPLHVDTSGIFLFGNDNGKATAMLLSHDASTIFWEQGFDDPEDLSWYIVDTMPWLLPQHIRYVGQECASLMRSMRENECYLQG